MMTTKLDNIELLLDDCRGIYIPQHFAENFVIGEGGWTGIDSMDLEVLEQGPEQEYYWDAWDSVLSSAEHHADDGRVFSLYQGGALFAIAYDSLTDEEYLELFGEERS